MLGNCIVGAGWTNSPPGIVVIGATLSWPAVEGAPNAGVALKLTPAIVPATSASRTGLAPAEMDVPGMSKCTLPILALRTSDPVCALKLHPIVTLSPGRHTLQLLLGDENHVPHNPPIMSKPIRVYVAKPRRRG
jgi:hypothetical protein